MHIAFFAVFQTKKKKPPERFDLPKAIAALR